MFAKLGKFIRKIGKKLENLENWEISLGKTTGYYRQKEKKDKNTKRQKDKKTWLPPESHLKSTVLPGASSENLSLNISHHH